MKYLIIVCLFFISCNEVKTETSIDIILKKAGSNKSQIQRTIEYYSLRKSDSLKLKALLYLLKGMDGMYYYEDEQLNKYQRYLYLVNKDPKNGEYVEKSFRTLYGPFDKSKLQIRYDLETVTTEQLKSNIDMAFKVWKEQPWGKSISFKQFCEYILPFRINDEVPSYNRKEIYEMFNPLLDSVRMANGTAVDACKIINDKLIENKWLFTTRIEYLPHFSANQIIKYRTGSCREMSDMALYIMRAVGIPVAKEFFMRVGMHNWNSVLSSEDKMIIFLGADDSPGTPHFAYERKAKVYRRTYLENPQSLWAIKGSSDIIPQFLQNSHLKDVTDEYLSCHDVSVKASQPVKTNQKFAFINVFNGHHWMPIHWGKLKNAHVSFSKMEDNVLYLPSYYTYDQQIRYLNYPLILQNNGKINYLIPDKHNTIDMTLEQRSPILPEWFWITMVHGGTFQGANKPDFSDATTLHYIKKKPAPFINTIELNIDQTFKYVRYLSPPEKLCLIGPISYYSSNKQLAGKFISKKGYYIERNINHNELTKKFIPGGYGSLYKNSGWVGLELSQPQRITKIEYTAQIGEKVNPTFVNNDQYVLWLWDFDDWKQVSKGIVENGKLSFKNVPSKGVYKLENLGDENNVIRLFTYENKKQVWW